MRLRAVVTCRVSNNLQEPLPIEVSHFGNFEARMLRNFQAAVEDWDEVCSALAPGKRSI